jgi:hypothetical protein
VADITAAIKTLFAADNGASGINTLLTGGIRTKRELGREGLSRTSTPTAYDGTTKLMLPNVVISQRAQIPTYDLADQHQQYVSTRQILELWFYNDNAYAALESARDRAYTLLHEKNISGVGRVTWIGGMDDARAEELNNAAMLKAEYQVDSYKSA